MPAQRPIDNPSHSITHETKKLSRMPTSDSGNLHVGKLQISKETSMIFHIPSNGLQVRYTNEETVSSSEFR